MGNNQISGNEHIVKDLGNNFPDGEKFFGLQNIDNICYSNSIFQAFYNCEPFKKKVLEYKSNKETKDNPISLLQEMFQEIQFSKKKTGVCSSKKIMKYVRKGNPDFKGENHQDCHEFSIWFLNQMNDILNKKYTKSKTNPNPPPKNQPSWLEEIFGGILTTQTTCLNCQKITERDEPFLDLSLDMVLNSSLTHCVKKLSEIEKMSGDDKFFCNTCNSKHDAEKQMLVKKLPQTLICHLKRFKYDDRLNRMIKLFWKVAFPLELKLTPNYIPPDKQNKHDSQIEMNYQLNSVIIHHGQGLSIGHYTALIKKTDSWYLYDDEQITQVDEFNVYDYFGSNNNPSCAYMLFYQQKQDD
ncbi:hypothetical protein ABPG74_022250 [Tetrahymena malaccensis]